MWSKLGSTTNTQLNKTESGVQLMDQPSTQVTLNVAFKNLTDMSFINDYKNLVISCLRIGRA